MRLKRRQLCCFRHNIDCQKMPKDWLISKILSVNFICIHNFWFDFYQGMNGLLLVCGGMIDLKTSDLVSGVEKVRFWKWQKVLIVMFFFHIETHICSTFHFPFLPRIFQCLGIFCFFWGFFSKNVFSRLWSLISRKRPKMQLMKQILVSKLIFLPNYRQISYYWGSNWQLCPYKTSLIKNNLFYVP